jgi:two-component system, chemotaxis family, chemotaxis protein CheY
VLRHCLIADDSDVIRKVAHHILEEVHITSTEAEDGPQALERCRAAMPDLIMLDWQMPKMSATDFLHLLRRTPGGDRPFVIYCTSENDQDDIVRAFEAGANDYLIKPYDRDSVIDKLAAAGAILRPKKGYDM